MKLEQALIMHTFPPNRPAPNKVDEVRLA